MFLSPESREENSGLWVFCCSPLASFSTEKHFPISVFIFIWHFSCIRVCLQISPFYKDINHIVLRAHLTPSSILTNSICNDYGQIRSHSEVAVAKASTYDFWGKTNSVHNKIHRIQCRHIWTNENRPLSTKSYGYSVFSFYLLLTDSIKFLL